MTKETKLNPKQESFCKLYATDREFFGNGVESYIEVYNPDRSKPNCLCRVVARIMSQQQIKSLIGGGTLSQLTCLTPILDLMSPKYVTTFRHRGSTIYAAYDRAYLS